jgi:hypothetical protein
MNSNVTFTKVFSSSKKYLLSLKKLQMKEHAHAHNFQNILNAHMGHHSPHLLQVHHLDSETSYFKKIPMPSHEDGTFLTEETFITEKIEQQNTNSNYALAIKTYFKHEQNILDILEHGTKY